MWSILLLGFLVLKRTECTLTEDDDDITYHVRMSNSASCDNVGLAQLSCNYEMHGVNLGFIWNEEDLDETCQALLKYADCVDDAVKFCSGSDHAVIVAKSETGVLRDLCDKHSNLRKDYLSNSPCLGGLLHYYPYGQECRKSGGILYEAYTNASRIQVHVGGYERKPCFQSAYATACIIATADRVCGADASAMLIEIAQRMKGIEEECHEHYIEEIKNEFYNFLKEKQESLGEDDSIPDEIALIVSRDEPDSLRMKKALSFL